MTRAITISKTEAEATIIEAELVELAWPVVDVLEPAVEATWPPLVVEVD